MRRRWPGRKRNMRAIVCPLRLHQFSIREERIRFHNRRSARPSEFRGIERLANYLDGFDSYVASARMAKIFVHLL
jgi:KaiC/GvpD/RAD55 family RecA-like ATPase